MPFLENEQYWSQTKAIINCPVKYEKLRDYSELLAKTNRDINLVSRVNTKDIIAFHIYYSIILSDFVTFSKKDIVVDIGTGGGLPGIPLAILFPDTTFHLLDSVQKKANAVADFVKKMEMKNAITCHSRIEHFRCKGLTYFLAKGVAQASQILRWSEDIIKKNSDTMRAIWLWKGGDIDKELSMIPHRTEVYGLDKKYKYLYDKFLLKIIHKKASR